MRALAGWAAVALAMSACTTLLGDDFAIGEGADGGASAAGGNTTTNGGSGGVTSGGGSGGAGGSTSNGGGATSASGGAGGGTGGTGGAGGCVLGTANGCESGFKCGITNFATGEYDCIPAGTRPAWARCNADSQCVVGTHCYVDLCRPVCSGALTCDTGGDCYETNIPELELCKADCDPTNALPCHQGFGATTCGRDGNNTLDCGVGYEGGSGSTCANDFQCNIGLFCGSSGVCFYSWCERGVSCNGGGNSCNPMSPPVFDNGGSEFGACVVN